MSLPAGRERHTILVVEDFEDTREVLALQLRQEGYEVVEAADGVSAVEMVKRRRPDLVLMDLSLPGRDGLSAAYRMRELDTMCGVPIVACTAHGAGLHRDVALAAGCDEYVTKPVDVALLKGVVARLLAGGGDADGGAEPGGPRRAPRGMDDEELRDYLDAMMDRRVAQE
ncbi:MAG TPA: response regulator [Pyrinomonadaceae bacterium]|jgi:CheY-like chemotaxis protein|nr:response regulator [Pyrinomonadaceae bacterium]